MVLVLPALPHTVVLPTFDDGSAFSSLFFSSLRDPLTMQVVLLWSGPGYQSPSHITVFRVWAGPGSAGFRRAKESTLKDEAKEDAGKPVFLGLVPSIWPRPGLRGPSQSQDLRPTARCLLGWQG